MIDNSESFKILTKQLVNFDKVIEFKTSCEENIKLIIDILRYDYVVTFHVGTITYRYDKDTQIATLEPEYLFSKDEYNFLIDKILNKLSSLKEEIIKFDDDLDKEKFIHDYLCKNVKYLDNGKESHCIIGPLLNGYGVCEGISKTAQALFKISNIESHTICGEHIDEHKAKTPHSWNAVKINDKWYFLDITFDNTISDDFIRYDYFNLCVSDVYESYVPEEYNKKYFYMCTNQLNYFELTNTEFFKIKDLFMFIKKSIQTKNKIIYFKFVNRIEYLDKNVLNDYILKNNKVSSIKYSSNEKLGIHYIALNYKQRLITL